MTKEELLKKIDFEKSWLYDCGIFGSDVDIAFHAIKNSVIETLEQEPCEDAINRQAVIDQTYLWSKDEFLRVTNPFDHLRKRINSLPSVNPQKSKTGHWITWKEADNVIPSETRFECSVCHDAAQTLCNGLDLLSPYCPNCGAKMVEPQESEVKE